MKRNSLLTLTFIAAAFFAESGVDRLLSRAARLDPRAHFLCKPALAFFELAIVPFGVSPVMESYIAISQRLKRCEAMR
jgi:hypothetical protein